MTIVEGMVHGMNNVIIVNQRNQGLSMARNAGLKAAKGDYVWFVDSDDYVDTKMYEVLYNAAKKHDADLVLSGVSFVGGNTFNAPGEYVEKDYFTEDTIFEDEDIKKEYRIIYQKLKTAI